MNEIVNDGDPWSPVDTPATLVPEEPLEIRGGNVTAHINLGTGEVTTEAPTEEELVPGEALVKSQEEHEAAAKEAETEAEETAAEVEAAEQTLAEKLAALDAAKTGKKTAAKK